MRWFLQFGLDVHVVAVDVFVPFTKKRARQFSDEDTGIASLEVRQVADWVCWSG